MGNVYAVVTIGIVTNLAQWDGHSDWTPPDGSEAALIPDDVFVDIGYLWDGQHFAKP